MILDSSETDVDQFEKSFFAITLGLSRDECKAFLQNRKVREAEQAKKHHLDSQLLAHFCEQAETLISSPA